MTQELAGLGFRALGSTAQVVVTNANALPVAHRVVQAELTAMDACCSRFRDSELTRLNAADGQWMPVSVLLAEAVAVAVRGARVSDGAVDPTVGRAMSALGYDRDFAQVPAYGPPITVLPARVAGWRSIEVRRDASGDSVRLPPGVALDLGATAKALAADRAASRAAAAAGCGVLVSLGGDIALGGVAPDGGWSVLVTDDHAVRSKADGQLVTLYSGGLATSSVTVRAWRRGGRPMHHILDPTTRANPAPYWRTASVAAACCVDANIASTAAIVGGECAPAWLAGCGLPARLVRVDGTVLRVAGWPADERPGATVGAQT